jgi:LPXTG-motif cell wall-anchored protein
VRGLLPSTGGGAALAVLGVGVVLILGGLTVRRVFR